MTETAPERAPARIHLDHAASSPIVPRALEAMVRHSGLVGNPAALHTSGRAARAVLEDAREQLAEAVGAHPTELIFTSGGSEANTIALHAGSRRPCRRTVLIGATEHPAVATARTRMSGVAVLGCDRDGLVDLQDLAARLEPATSMVSVMTVNNETGAIQPVSEAAELAHRVGAWFHTDAVQALGHVPLDFATSGVDLMSLSAHKVGGPVGIGALVVRRDVDLPPWGLGGGQERDVRSGTQSAVLASAFAAAATTAVDNLKAEHDRLSGMRNRFVERVRSTITGCYLNGPAQGSPAIVNMTFDGTRADDVLMLLDHAGIDCSTGSACRAGVHQPSDVLLAMGRTLEQASASIRFSFGPTTTAEELATLAGILPDVVSRARAACSVAVGEGEEHA